MSNAGDGVQIDPQQVSNATAQLDATAATLSSEWQARLAAIAALSTDATWGTDESGRRFAGSYADGGGLEMQSTGDPVVADVVAFGPDVRTAVEASLAADEVQARLVDVPVEGL